MKKLLQHARSGQRLCVNAAAFIDAVLHPSTPDE
jgi:hypothetical protein